MNKFLRRVYYWLRQRKIDAELAEELEFHRSKLRESGEASRVMGNETQAREDARAVWIWPWVESVWQDLAYAARTLRTSPGFVLTVLLTLGSAIGLNTSLFTVFNALALRPWRSKIPRA